MKNTDQKPADVARAAAAQRHTLTTSAGDAGAQVPDREKPTPSSPLARQLKAALGIPEKSDRAEPLDL